MFDVKDVLDSMEKIVAGSPGYVYRDEFKYCNYSSPEGAPGCLIGHILDDLVPDIFVQVCEWENDPAQLIPGPHGRRGSFSIMMDEFWSEELTGNYSGLGAKVMKSFTRNALLVMATAQSFQDSGSTWLRALKGAQRRALYVDTEVSE